MTRSFPTKVVIDVHRIAMPATATATATGVAIRAGVQSPMLYFYCLSLPLLFILGFPTYLFAIGNEAIKNFYEAKKLATYVHLDHPYTLYCHCKFSGKNVDIKSCGYKVYGNARKAVSLEWEHVVPAEAFGQSFVEWRDGAANCVSAKGAYRGRRCARKNPQFARIESDLYNLFPEIGELNGLRKNYSMAEIASSNSKTFELLEQTEGNQTTKITKDKVITFGECKVFIFDQKFSPSNEAKGIVARTYLYMDLTYPNRGIISGKNRKLFQAWDKLFPTTAWECLRAKKIKEIQGNENSILADRCKL